MSQDKELEEFLRRYIDCSALPRPRKPAQEIMVAGMPSCVGPRLDVGRNGRKRWVTRLDRKTDLKRFTTRFPVL